MVQSTYAILLKLVLLRWNRSKQKNKGGRKIPFFYIDLFAGLSVVTDICSDRIAHAESISPRLIFNKLLLNTIEIMSILIDGEIYIFSMNSGTNNKPRKRR